MCQVVTFLSYKKWKTHIIKNMGWSKYCPQKNMYIACEVQLLNYHWFVNFKEIFAQLHTKLLYKQ